MVKFFERERRSSGKDCARRGVGAGVGWGGYRNFPGEKIKDSKRIVIPC